MSDNSLHYRLLINIILFAAEVFLMDLSYSLSIYLIGLHSRITTLISISLDSCCAHEVGNLFHFVRYLLVL
uniref:Ovule protein n=1 Tax=Heterorhabditis bacteriophora TaxID=37862 RepID=A0A1I7W6A2_HETBA